MNLSVRAHQRVVLPLATLALATMFAAPAHTQSASSPARINVDGTVTLTDKQVPLSNLLSPEGAAYLRHLIVDKPFGSGPTLSDIKAERARQDGIMEVFLAPMRKRYAVKVTEQKIGGIVTDVVVPEAGIAPENKTRVLLNVHGGGFTTGSRSASLVESIPLAAIMKIKVISIDYRMAPEYQFPAASEDVASVYREVLRTYDAQQIALYGCSAGGMLAAESVAWFQTHGLPNPAAIGVFCASLGVISGGDSGTLAMSLLGATPPAPSRPASTPPVRTYLGAARPDDPLAYPQASPAVLAKFPPTLFITGTRSFEFSAALNSHNKLTQAGVESQFHGWDGMFHGFIYNSEMPESREAYDIMTKFFGSHMVK